MLREFTTFYDWLNAQGVLTIIVACGLFLYLAYRGVIKIPGIQKKMSKGNPHEGCIHVNDVMIRFDAVIETVIKRDKIIFIERVREQMMIAEVVVSECLGLMRTHYLKVLKEKTGTKDGLISNPEYKCYENMLKGLREFQLTKLRFIFRENHIPVEEAQFAEWARRKANKLISETTEYINASFVGGKVGREYLYDTHYGKVDKYQGIVNDVKDKIIDGFRQAKIIGEEKEAKANKLKNEVKALLPRESENAI